jgi:AraC-like DNA-binding protein
MAKETSPLSQHKFFQTKEVEEVSSVLSEVYCPVKVEPMGRRVPFEFRMNRAVLGPVGVGVASFRRGVEIYNEVVLDKFFLCFSRGSRGMLRHTGIDVPIIPGLSGAIASPLVSRRLVHESDYRSLTVAVRRQTMESALMALYGVTRPLQLQFEPQITISSGTGADILRLIEFIVSELNRPNSILNSPLITASLTDALVFGLLTGQPHSHTALFQSRTRSAEPRYVRQVEEYLAAKSAEAISLSELSALAGISVRAIQAGFKAYRGYSPMAFLKERRLELANRRFLGAPPGTTVAEIALDCGFAHIGRFSVTYRKRFGESPSHTLRRVGALEARSPRPRRHG